MSDSQICANSCPKAVGGEPCAHCPLVAPVEVRDAKTQAVLDGLDASIEKTDELTAPMLDQSANAADLMLFFWVALVLVIAVMWAFGQSSPVRMCGGV